MLRAATAAGIVLAGATAGGVLAGYFLAVRTSDKAAVIADVLAAATLTLAGIAAYVALRAYLIAAGKPDLVLLRADAGRWPLRLPTLPRQPGYAFPRIGVGNRAVPGNAQSINLAIRNAGDYSARNPAVKITLHGFWVPQQQPGWTVITPGPGSTAQTLQWDGGADYAVHGSWTRVLPPVVLDGGLSAGRDHRPQLRAGPATLAAAKDAFPWIEYELVADGVRCLFAEPVVALPAEDPTSVRPLDEAQARRLIGCFAGQMPGNLG